MSQQKEKGSPMTINIKYNANDTIPIEVYPSWNVGMLKREISKKRNIDVSEIRIIFMGREIHDAMTIQHCDLGNNSVLHTATGKAITLDAEMPPSIPQEPAQTAPPRITDVPDHYKSQFYVYCKSRCKDVKTGKIRVRCKKCQYGGFEVQRDPTCWEDVLLPNQIPGNCSSQNCDGKFTEFYFKCKAHDTGEKETSAPLNLIRPNSNSVNCIICFEQSNPVVIWPCDQQHCICLDCFKQYGEAKLDERAFIQDDEIGYTLPCPAPSCQTSFIKEPHHFHILGDEQYERYHRFGMEEFVLKSGGVLCPQPDCSAPILLEHQERKIRCNCGFIFCRLCKAEYHAGDCFGVASNPSGAHQTDQRFEVNQQRADEARWEQAARETIKETTKACPNPTCRSPTEKNGGCMHMTCARCKHHWCWICGKEWTRDCQSDHWFG